MAVHVGAQVLLLGALSWASSYPWPDLRRSSWDLALFLTPVGILRNHLAESMTALRSFYSDPARGQGGDPGSLALAAMSLVVFLLLVNAVWAWKGHGPRS